MRPNLKNSLDLYKKQPVKEQVSVIGVPYEEGSNATGLKLAPAYLRKIGIVKELKLAGLNVIDAGDVELKPAGKSKEAIKRGAIKMAEIAADKVAGEIEKGNKVLAIGGDHAVSLGTIAGAARAAGDGLAVIWIDAHPDLCTWDESVTKNIHGMQAAALLGEGDKGLVNAAGKKGKIKKHNIFYIGLKDMDPPEIEFLLKNNIKVITIHDIEREGMQYVLSEVEKFLNNKDQIWVSVDMDGIEKRYVPSSPMATDEGLSAREVLSLARLIGRSGKVIGADIVELSAKGDTDNMTGLLAIDIAAKLFGTDRGWYERYMLPSSK
jgi:arginase